jgi:hypothetical protein
MGYTKKFRKRAMMIEYGDPPTEYIDPYDGAFYCHKLNLASRIPAHVKGDLYFSFSPGDKFIHLKKVSAQRVDGNVDMQYMHLRTLEGIGKTCLVEVHGNIILRATVKRNVLGLLKVKCLTRVFVHFNQWRMFGDTDRCIKAIDIIDAHLKADRDVMECHEELTRAGLKEFAKF